MLLSIVFERFRLSGVEYGVMVTQTVKIDGGRRGTGTEEEVNGEVVRSGIDEYQHWVLVRGGIIGTGFLLSLVGLYGDHK